MPRHHKSRQKEHSGESRESRKRHREEMKREKELAKLLETPEEKLARRREKKMKKHGFLGSSTQSLGYTNESNPFGDSRLTDKFVWKKKKEQEETEGIVRTSEEEAKRREMLRVEIEKARERRKQSDKEKAEWEAEKERMAREAEVAAHEGWEEQEEAFHMDQERLRSDIRVKQGRARPIDTLAKLLDNDLSVPLMTMEPYRMVDGCTLAELEDLASEVQVKKALGDNLDVWNALNDVIKEAINKQKRGSLMSHVHGIVRRDVGGVFKDKTPTQLDEMADSIRAKLYSGDAVDAEYWEDMLSQLKLHRARAVLDEAHRKMLNDRLSMLESTPAAVEPTPEREAERPKKIESAVEEMELGDVDAGFELVGQTTVPNSEVPEDDGENVDSDADADELIRQKRGEKEGDFVESVELGGKTYRWSDRYRPRAPKYFNRVMTGYEWNKYNSTHYDLDTPPPRVVLGYKFNIFYPDLIDKNKTPKYYIDALPETRDFVTIRFHAGAPYEDVAFKIINREWDIGTKTGFRSEFKGGVLSVYFRFKKYRYRR